MSLRSHCPIAGHGSLGGTTTAIVNVSGNAREREGFPEIRADGCAAA